MAKFAAMRRASCNGLVNNRGCASITGPAEGILLLTLVGYPNTANADTWDHGGDGDKSIYYLVWPADDGPKRVRICISTRAFGDYCGDAFGVDIGKAALALVRHRDLIQQLARAKYRPGVSIITLDIGDFPTQPKGLVMLWRKAQNLFRAFDLEAFDKGEKRNRRAAELQRAGLSKHDYYPLVAHAVAGLGNSSARSVREALYERARAAQRDNIDPALSKSEIVRERAALEQAIQKVEAETVSAEREQADSDSKIVFGFSNFCEKTTIRPDRFYDASMLPYPREAIISAMEREIVRSPYQAQVDWLRGGGRFLMNFLEGVGPDPIPFRGGPARDSVSRALKGNIPAGRDELWRILASSGYKQDEERSSHFWAIADRENTKVEERIASALRARNKRLAVMSQTERAALDEQERKFKEFSKNNKIR